MSIQDDDTTNFIYNSMMHHTAQLSHYDAANRRRRTLDFLSQNLEDEMDMGIARSKRIKALETELAEGEAILTWHADRRETCRQLRDEALKAAGVTLGLADESVKQRRDEQWRAVRTDEDWQERRAGLNKRRLEALRKHVTT